MPLPTIQATGNLVEDAELNWTASGLGFVKLRIAFNNPKLNKQTNKWEDQEPLYLNATCWKNAEAIAAQATKGKAITIIGKLKPNTYQTKDGEKKTSIEIQAEEIAFPIREDKSATPATDDWSSPNF